MTLDDALRFLADLLVELTPGELVQVLDLVVPIVSVAHVEVALSLARTRNILAGELGLAPLGYEWLIERA